MPVADGKNRGHYDDDAATINSDLIVAGGEKLSGVHGILSGATQP